MLKNGFIGSSQTSKPFLSGVAIFFFIILSGSVYAAPDNDPNQFWVRTDGNNSCNGQNNMSYAENSTDCAWLTIQKAADTLTAGQKVRVQNGTYNEKIIINTASGTSGNNIIYQGDDNPKVENNISSSSIPAIFTLMKDYITIAGFNITSEGDINGIQIGRGGSGASDAQYVNISNNHIQIINDTSGSDNGGHGIYMSIASTIPGSGNNSIIEHNTILADKGAIVIDINSPYNITNLTIYNNTVQGAAGIEDGGGQMDYGIGVKGGALVFNSNISYNKIIRSGWSAFKPQSENSTFIGNEITNKPCHNSIDAMGSYTRWIDTYIHDINETYATRNTDGFSCTNNQFMKAGIAAVSNVYVENITIENPGGGGKGISVGGAMWDFLIINVTITNHTGRPIQVGDVEEDAYSWESRSTNNATFVNFDVEGNNVDMVYIISLGTNTSSNHSEYWNYAEDKISFINFKATGTYSGITWRLTTDVNYESNRHFNGTVRVINANKDDVWIEPGASGWHNGSIIFYQYVDVRVQDTLGNNLSDVNVSFSSNVSEDVFPSWVSTKPKNIDYTFNGYDGETQDRTWTLTGSDGHTPKPSNESWTVALPYKYQNLTDTIFFNWTVNASKFGYSSNSTSVVPDSSWHRSNPDTYQNTTLIVLLSQGLQLNLNSPANSSYSDNNITISGLTSDSANVSYSLNGATNTTICTSCTSFFAWNDSTLVGSNNITVYAVNAANVSDTDSNTVYFTVDTTPPKASFFLPTPGNGATLSSSTSSVTINVSIVEANPDKLVFNWNGNNETYDYSAGYWNITKSVSAGNSYGFYVWANDTLGNSNQTEVRSFTVQSSSDGSSPGGGGGGGGSTKKCIAEGFQSLGPSLMKSVITELNLKYKLFYSVEKTLAPILALTGDVLGEYPAPTDTEVQGILANPMGSLDGDVYQLSAERISKRWTFSNTVIVARGDLEVDSIAALAFAKTNKVPILLTRTAEVPDVTLSALKKLNPERIIIVGGPVAVSNEVAAELEKIAPVERIWGENREETAVEVAEHTDGTKVIDTIVIADGRNTNADAVFIANGYRAPIVYVSEKKLPKVTRDFLEQHKRTSDVYRKPMKVVFVGVSEEVRSEIEDLMRL